MHILILTDDDVLKEERITSTGIRQLELAKRWSKQHDVTIATTYGKPNESDRDQVHVFGGIGTLDFISDRFNVVVIELSSNLSSIACRYVVSSINLPTVIDSYYSIFFEKLVALSDNDRKESILVEKLHILRKILSQGDHFIVATEKQRDYMYGFLSSIGKIHLDANQNNLISIIPHTIDLSSSISKKKFIKGSLIHRKADIIMWLGSILPWFDFSLMTRSMEIVSVNNKNATIVVVGGKHPLVKFENSNNQYTPLANQINMQHQKIVFMDWVSKEQSLTLCSEADVFVSFIKPSLEDLFSFRTRVLTALSLGVPVVTNGEDYLSLLITKHNAGIVCVSGNSKEIAAAISRILGNSQLRHKMSRNTCKVIKEIQSDIVEDPILSFFKKPFRVDSIGMTPLQLLKFFVRTILLTH